MNDGRALAQVDTDAWMTRESQTELWVSAARAGDQLALAKLLALHHPALAARVRARLDPAVRARLSPEDVLQEVYLLVFRQVERFEDRGPDSFLHWVTTILDNKLIDVQRAAHRAQRDVSREKPIAPIDRTGSYWNLLDHVYHDTATPSRVVRREEAIGALMTCVSGLAEAHRRIIELRFLEGLPLAEVAQRMQKTEGAVVAMTQRALKALRDSMEQLGDYTRGG